MSRSSGSLSLSEARRLALAGQGFCDPPHTKPTLRTLMRTIGRTGVLQVDSVNVLARAHLMPLYARMGPYDPDLLSLAAEAAPRRLVEYWAHVQALMPVELWPLMAHRRDFYRSTRGKWKVLDASPLAQGRVLAQVGQRGPVTARELDDGSPRSKEAWGWNWSDARKILDYLYMVGEVAIAGRNAQFEVLYDLPERVLPPAVLAMPVPSQFDAQYQLVERAARSLAVATVSHLADYFRMSVADTRQAVTALVEEGVLAPVRVQRLAQPAFLHRDAVLPRTVAARTLLSPFDPLVWERNRTEAIFGFHYRIEIYVPKSLRRYGYYVLPFLLGDQLVGRVDLKADRGAKVLAVRGAFAEPHASQETAEQLWAELLRIARWLGLHSVSVDDRGDLSGALRAIAAR